MDPTHNSSWVKGKDVEAGGRRGEEEAMASGPFDTPFNFFLPARSNDDNIGQGVEVRVLAAYLTARGRKRRQE